MALLALGHPDDGERALADAASGALARHERPYLWRAHAARAGLLVAQGRPDEARSAAVTAQAVIEELAGTLPEGEERDGFLRRAVALLTAGQSDDAPAPRLSPADRGQPVTLPSGLSRREAQVLGLLAAGRSNREIAAALCLSPRTVQRHIANAYAKIGAHNKAHATAYALHHRLA
jgi:DNA-binding CsgD family transcriptional regulator